MALINFRLPSWNTDIVSIVDPTTSKQVFKDARPARTRVTDNSVLMEQPREDGTVQIDHAIIEPIVIEMELVLGGLDARNVIADIQNFKDTGTQLTVNLKAGAYDEMFIEGIGHEEMPEMFNSFPISLRLKEALLTTSGTPTITTETAATADDASTIQKGIQGAITAVASLEAAGDEALNAYKRAAEFGE